ncbi:WD40 repeat-like protein [Ascobolus immersus RN42]|uniref:Ribosome assembly protein 4 n=1 Tax=Ascobolus immersus RN42 TaxID=1160509 RepID=A0A3N4IJP4_ASCIM|nr:WD40 repeat-like protein [Ascobolus immersus RN42]
MSTVLPPKSKRVKVAELEKASTQFHEEPVVKAESPNIVITLRAADTNNPLGGKLFLPADTTPKQLSQIVNKLLGTEDNPTPYNFAVPIADGTRVTIGEDFNTSLLVPGHKKTEDVIEAIFTPQAVFRVRAVTRCTGAIAGHGDNILAAAFSPENSSRLVTGSGDKTARIWDCNTETPMHTLKGHKGWVLSVSWSPDAQYIATGSHDGGVRLWDPKTGKPHGDDMKGHTKWVTALSWEPYHLWEGDAVRFASSSKDGTIRVWDAKLRRTVMHMSGHSMSVTCVKWGGLGFIYSASQDKTIKVWDGKDGKLLHTLNGHAHWINHLALSTDFVLRTGYFDPMSKPPTDAAEKKKKALERFNKAAMIEGRITERLASASDDFTMYLWEPAKSTKPLVRLQGHQKLVNHVSFSPDGLLIASASFDNLVKLWSAHDGKFIASLRGHVAPVYQCAFSADSRLLVSSSKDTTLKVWDVKTGKLHKDLPGHQDEVYAVDWAPDGQKVASGGKDKAVRLWKH